MKFNNPKTIYKAVTFTVGLFLVFLFSFSMAHAQSGSSLWKLSGTNLLPVNSTWNLKIPALNTTGSTKCVNVSSTGQLGVASDDCGTGGGGGISDGDKGDVTVSSSGAVWTIDNQAVTFAKFQNITANRLLGREATTGSVQEIQLSGRFDLNAGILDILGGTPDGAVGTYQFNLDGTSFSGTDIISTPDSGGTVNIQDKFAYFADDSDPTKRARLELSGLTGGVDRILTPQDSNGTLAYLGNKLSAFASTTSVELATVLFDETGTDKVVYSTSPTLVTPNIGSASASALNVSGLTASRAVVTDGSKNLASSAVTSTELGHVSGVTSAIQTQINTKAPTASPTFTGTVTIPSPFVVGANNFTRSGSHDLTLTTTGSTNVTLPTTGTLVNDAVTALNSLGTVSTSLTGTLRADAGVLSTDLEAYVATFGTASTSYVDVTGLNNTLAANTSYKFELTGDWTSNNNSGAASIGLTLPAGASFTMTRGMGTTSSAISWSMQNTNNQSATVNIGTANGIRTVTAIGVLTTAGTAGDLQIRLLSNNASYTATVSNMFLTSRVINQ